MKKLVFSGIFLLFCNFASWSQNQNSIWSLPPYSITYSPNPPYSPYPPTPLPTPSDGYDDSPSGSCSNAISDVNGDLLFFVTDDGVYDKDGYIIALFDDLKSNLLFNSPVKGLSETMIVPHPTDCSKYLIFVGGRKLSYSGFSPREVFLTTLDLSAVNDGMYYSEYPPVGRLGTLSQFISVGGSTPGFMEGSKGQGGAVLAASKKRSDGSRFIFISNGYRIFRYVYDNTGNFYYDNYATPYFPYPAGNQSELRSEMELIELPNGHYRIATPYLFDSITWVTNPPPPHFEGESYMALYTAELNNAGVLISGTVKKFKFLSNEYIHGLEYSSDGNVLYLTHHNTSSSDPNAIEFFDYNNPSLGFQNLHIPNAADFQFSQIELAQDGKLYFVGESNEIGNRFATLKYPNTPNIANWLDYSQTINYLPSYEFAPNQVSTVKSYTLPDQIDGMDYEARFTQNLQCCKDSRAYDVGLETFGGSHTWTPGGVANNPFASTSGTVYVREELRIKAGAKITIKNMTFKFAPGARVIIERGSGSTPGGKLIMDNTTFTVDDQCDPGNLMWLGVQVWGNSNAAQIPTSHTVQGQLIMQNNAIIEYAQVGAMATKRLIPQNSSPWLYTGSYNYSYDGGIIIASNSSFRNNRADIVIKKYIAPPFGSGDSPINRCSFTNCRFYTDGLLTHLGVNYPVGRHVEIINTEGVNFYGCDFENEVPNLFSEFNRGLGIFSYNTRFAAVGRCGNINCTNPDRGTFKNLFLGIYALSDNGINTIKINKNDFINNLYGLKMINCDVATITNNNFEVYPSASPNYVGKTFGMSMYSCTGYHVENNYFTHYNDPNVLSIGNTYGVIVDNSGNLHNEIYRNTFKDLSIGIQAQRFNGENFHYGDPDPSNEGLQFRCNLFQKNIMSADIAVTSGRVDYLQGYQVAPSDPNMYKTPAGNRFSHTVGSALDIAANPNVLNFSYSHHSDNITTPLAYSTQKVTLWEHVPPIYYNSSACPSKLIGSGVPAGATPNTFFNIVQLHLINLKDSLKNVIVLKKNQIDGGNTSDLLSAIASQSPGQIKNTLMNASPYLSDTVLMTYLNQNPPNGHVKQVVVANSPVTPPVYQKVLDMNLPHGIQNQIDNAQEGVSARTYLESTIAFNTDLRTSYLYDLINLYLFDTTSTYAMDSLKALIAEEGHADEWRKLLFDAYCSIPDSSKASTQRQAVISGGTCSHFDEISAIQLQLLSADGVAGAINANAQMKADLTSIAACTDACCNIKAKCLLALANDSLLPTYIEDLMPSNTAIAQNNGGDGMLGAQETASNINIYPNPSEGTQTVKVQLISKDKQLVNSHIEVYNLAGQLMYTASFKGNTKTVSFDAAVLHQGIYFVKLISQGALVEVKKLLINQ